MKAELHGRAVKKGVTPNMVDSRQLKMGVKVEMEHTDDKKVSKTIAMDHLSELPDYYTRLDKMEKRALAAFSDELEKIAIAISPAAFAKAEQKLLRPGWDHARINKHLERVMQRGTPLAKRQTAKATAEAANRTSVGKVKSPSPSWGDATVDIPRPPQRQTVTQAASRPATTTSPKPRQQTPVNIHPYASAAGVGVGGVGVGMMTQQHQQNRQQQMQMRPRLV